MRIISPMVLAAAALVVSSAACAQSADGSWQREFALSECQLSTTGRNRYFVLEPGFQLVLQSGEERLHVTVLNETRTIDGVLTRVVEEREWKDGQLYEISRNYFAICPRTADVFYFGEHVDFYEGRKVVRHDGTWVAGEKGSKAGLIMPGTPRVGMKYYQEIAPEVAMDRAEIVKVDATCETPAGKFSNCLIVREGTPLEPGVEEFKSYAPDIGLIQDEDLKLVKYGFVKD